MDPNSHSGFEFQFCVSINSQNLKLHSYNLVHNWHLFEKISRKVVNI